VPWSLIIGESLHAAGAANAATEQRRELLDHTWIEIGVHSPESEESDESSGPNDDPLNADAIEKYFTPVGLALIKGSPPGYHHREER
jgi:hypothetical protein